jgi:hypothetical protein
MAQHRSWSVISTDVRVPLDQQTAARLEYLVAARVEPYASGERNTTPAPSSGRESVGMAGPDGVSVASGGLPSQHGCRVPVVRSRGSAGTLGRALLEV